MKPISYFCDTPAIQQLEALFGSRFEQMELEDRLCIIVALTHGLSHHLQGLESLPLDDLCVVALGQDFADFQIPQLLRQLDGELNHPQQVCQLISALAQSCAEPLSAAVFLAN
ncbi:MAG: hypothetical protein F6K04_19680 [Leptolyngbya sp. SIO4C5]|nr:hypothetical protein [Leptolyngbya sp. SIO4C5]